jgi:hypothetical protein
MPKRWVMFRRTAAPELAVVPLATAGNSTAAANGKLRFGLVGAVRAVDVVNGLSTVNVKVGNTRPGGCTSAICRSYPTRARACAS